MKNDSRREVRYLRFLSLDETVSRMSAKDNSRLSLLGVKKARALTLSSRISIPFF